MNQEKLLKLFRYEDGKLYRRNKMPGFNINKPIGYVRFNGYIGTMVEGNSYLLHRLIFEYHHGFVPEQIDHVNGIIDDNRIENLRSATHGQNMKNTKLRKDNKAGVKGVYKCKNSWAAAISNNGIRTSRYFKTKEKAEEHVEMLRSHLHGEYANNGKPNTREVTA